MGDYRRFKTPFYEITISDPNGKRKIKLPHHILRLISRVDIQRTISGFDIINLEIIEGSREPASQDPSAGTSGLYNLDSNIGGSITNRTGAVTNLRFSGNNGITFFNEFERNQGAIDRRVQKNIDGNKTTRAHPEEPKTPIFLFQERNLITIRWGYREDPSLVSTASGRIVMFTTDYPDTGPIKSKIVASSTEIFLDQITATKGKTFGEVVTTGAGNKILGVKDKATDVMLKEICDASGIDCIISPNLPAATLEKDRAKVLMAGQSFKQFLDALALESNCYYKMIPNEDGKETLIFIKKSDYEKEVAFKNTELFTYKSPGSIIKSISIKADFSGFERTSQVGSDENGDSKEVTTEVGLFSVHNTELGGKREQIYSQDPRDISPIKSLLEVINPKAKNFTSVDQQNFTSVYGAASDNYSSKVEITPNESNDSDYSDAAAADNEMEKRILTLDMTLIGFPILPPGVIEIKGLGARYNGKYRIQTLQHIIDDAGYFTKVVATSFATAFGGTRHPDLPKGIEIPNQEEVSLFKAANVTPDGKKVEDEQAARLVKDINKIIINGSTRHRVLGSGV